MNSGSRFEPTGNIYFDLVNGFYGFVQPPNFEISTSEIFHSKNNAMRENEEESSQESVLEQETLIVIPRD